MRRFTTELTVFLLVLLFAYACTSKFLDYERFVFQMKLSPFPPVRIGASFLGWFVPTVELTIVLLLLFPKAKLKGLYASLVLLSFFELYIFGMLLSGTHLPCTCGGVISKLSWKGHLFFNAFFIVITAMAIRNLKQHMRHSSEESFINYSRA